MNRPDGRPYRPRKPGLRARPWGEVGDRHGVIVFGTLDTERARTFAAETITYWHDAKCHPVRPEPGWWRDGYNYEGRAWIPDDKRGAPGVSFTCEES